jgi:hypothetical protein
MSTLVVVLIMTETIAEFPVQATGGALFVLHRYV